jgi:hypothetical protein
LDRGDCLHRRGFDLPDLAASQPAFDLEKIIRPGIFSLNWATSACAIVTEYASLGF